MNDCENLRADHCKPRLKVHKHLLSLQKPVQTQKYLLFLLQYNSNVKHTNIKKCFNFFSKF